MTTAEARRLLGNDNRIANILELHRSSVGRWGRMVPKHHREVIRAVVLVQCKNAGWQTPMPLLHAAAVEARGYRRGK